jgi:hypothetical protein
LAPEFPAVNFSKLDPLYPSKTGIYEFSRRAVLARGQAALQALYSRPEKVIAVVSHSAFLRTSVSNRRFANADYRIFEFEDVVVEGGKEVFKLKESEETARNGGGMGWSIKGIHGILEGDFDSDTGVDGAAAGEVPPA